MSAPVPPLPEMLYQLLPAVYRRRDFAQGEPLRALLGVMETEMAAVRADVEALYDNWFIETCDVWVVPYIAALVDAGQLSATSLANGNLRAYVANTVAYRRRKGTAAALSDLAHDLTGWPAQAMEFFQRTDLTQPISMPRPTAIRTPSLRLGNPLGLLGGPFDQACYSVELRGKYNLPTVGVYLWRLLADPITQTPAAPVPGYAGCYTFDPLGIGAPLFNPDRVLSGVSAVVNESTTPGPLRARALSDDLGAIAAGQAPSASLYFGAQPSFQIFLGGSSTPVPPEQIVIMGLGRGQLPTASTTVAVDPVLGRLAFPSAPSSPPLVSYYRGLPSTLGGGGYDRDDVIVLPATASITGGAAAQWSPAPAIAGAVLEIGDNLVYTPPALNLLAGASVELRAANRQRPLLRPAGGVWQITLGAGASLTLDGLLVDGALSIVAAGPATLTLLHCTVTPSHGVTASGALTLVMTRSITGAVTLDPVQSTLTVTDSILGAVTAGSATVTGVTVLGGATFAALGAADSLFTGAVTSGAAAPGYPGAATSFVPPGSSSLVPQSNCQPELAVAAGTAGAALVAVAPAFKSLSYGDPGYARLRDTCAAQIGQGAADGGEMGAFHHLGAPQRVGQLESGLTGYLRFGLTAGVFFVT